MAKTKLVNDLGAANMIKISTTFDSDTLVALESWCDHSGMPRAEALRRAARKWLAERVAEENQGGWK